MNIIGCLDVPTAGTYRLNGRDVGKMSRNELASKMCIRDSRVWMTWARACAP